MEHLEIEPHTYTQLFFDKGAKTFSGENFSTNSAREIHIQ
jgi:hypothetical protein